MASPNRIITPRPACPKCRSMYVVKDERNKYGDQRWRCKKCRYSFYYKRIEPQREKSGVIPVPCRERPFVPLRGPDPRMEHMRLCMETRRT